MDRPIPAMVRQPHPSRRFRPSFFLARTGNRSVTFVAAAMGIDLTHSLVVGSNDLL